MQFINFANFPPKKPEPVRTIPSIRKIMDGSRLEKIPIDKIYLAENYPFEAYEDYELTDLIEEIRENGVITPVIARETDAGFEIIDGRARFLAASEAGDEVIPAVIINCSDEEALELIEYTTIIYQKSFRDMKYSQQARIIARYYGTLKKQGMRSDLIYRAQHGEDRMGYELREEVYEARKKHFNRESWAGNGIKYKSYDVKDEAAKKYRLSGRNVARYLRIDKLTNGLKNLLDDGIIGFTAAVELSFLDETQQGFVEESIAEGAKITVLNANKLKQMVQRRHYKLHKAPPIGRENIRAALLRPEKQEENIENQEEINFDEFQRSEPFKSPEEVEEFLLKTYPEYFEPKPEEMNEKDFLIAIMLAFYHRLRNAVYTYFPNHFPSDLPPKKAVDKFFGATVLYFLEMMKGNVKPPSPNFGI